MVMEVTLGGVRMVWPGLEVSFGMGLVWFTLLHAFYASILRRVVPGFAGFQDFRKWEWSNRVVATIVCVTMSACVGWYWATRDNVWMWEEDKTQTVGAVEKGCITFMIGYLLYDLVVCVFVESEITWLFIAHHVIGLISHMLVLTVGDGIGAYYSMAVYISEGSTPFMHVAWMLNELCNQKNEKNARFWSTGVPSIIFTLIKVMLLLSFFLLRAVLSPYIFYHTVVYGIPAWHALHEDWLGYAQSGIILLFTCINLHWFTELVKVAVKSFSGEKVNEAKKDQ